MRSTVLGSKPERIKKGDIVSDRLGIKYVVDEVGMRYLNVRKIGGTGGILMLRVADALRVPNAVPEQTARAMTPEEEFLGVND